MRIPEEKLHEAIDAHGEARDLLDIHYPKANKRFEKIVSNLNKLIREVQKTFPDANYYLANDTLNLMLGPSHASGCNQMPNSEFVAVYAHIDCASGGDW